MKVVYNFIYADPDGKPQEFQMPVNVTEDTDADLMYDLCLSYLKIGHVGGTPLHAVSTSKQYPNYCFTSTACDDEYQACRSKKLSGAQPYQPQSLDGKKIYIYEGKFAKVGQFGNRIIQKILLVTRTRIAHGQSDSGLQESHERRARRYGLGTVRSYIGSRTQSAGDD